MENLPIKVPPHNIEAEQQILGACFVNSGIIPKVRELIDPGDMYREAHGIILAALFELKNADLVTLKNHLETLELLEKAGAPEYLMDLTEYKSTSIDYPYWCDIVKKKSELRKIITFCQDTGEQCFSNTADPITIITNSKETIQDIQRSKIIDIESNSKFYLKVYEGIYNKQEPGLYAGIDCLEDKLYFEEDYIHIIAAESGVGKSAFSLQIAELMSSRYGPALFYSLESTKAKLARRNIARHSKVALTRINRCNFENEHQNKQILEACEAYSQSNLILEDNARYMEVEKLINNIEVMILKKGIRFVVIDFFQQLYSLQKFTVKRDMIGYILRKLKQTAKDFNIPIIIVCQLRKDIPARPTLDDLYESNELRTLTDNILFMWSPELKKEPERNIYAVELFMAKGKDQDKFSQWLEFNGNFQLFTEGTPPLSVVKKSKKDWQDDD